MSVFGFSTESNSGDYLPIIKYDARAGRIFRIDRVETGGQFINEPVDITKSFKAIADLENLETGWVNFSTGGAPSFALAKIGSPLPPRPSPDHKNGVRFMIKLSKDIAGDKPIREVASPAKAFLAGLEELYLAYQAEAPKQAGKLPIVVLADTVPIKSGSGDKQSTNYKPVFKITGWAPRGDLVFVPKGGEAPAAVAQTAPKGPPATGSTRVEAPARKAEEMASAEDDFG